MTIIINPDKADPFDGKWHHIKFVHYSDTTKEDVIEIDSPLAVIDMNDPDPQAFEKAWNLQLRKMIYTINELDEKLREELT